VFCQNSGLGNAVNPLTSLNHPFRIPSLLLVTWRGQPGLPDEPQHAVMGELTHQLLTTIRLPHADLVADAAGFAGQIATIDVALARDPLPFALVVARDAIAGDAQTVPPDGRPPRGEVVERRTSARPTTRHAVLRRFLDVVPEAAAVIATTGKCGRELFTLADRPQHLYQVGSMGGASAMALGVALNTLRPVVVLDGDGAALMKLGNLATIGRYRPRNLVHIVLDNGVHDSTGGQATASANVDFADIAVACGYAAAFRCNDPEGVAAALTEALRRPGPNLIHIAIGPGSLANLGRPTITPEAVARRFRSFVTGS